MRWLMSALAGLISRLRESHAAQNELWERYLLSLRPWEEEGPLRWVRTWNGGWRLIGATMPAVETPRGDDHPCRTS